MSILLRPRPEPEELIVMRILIVTQIYLPEMGALSNRLYPFVRALHAAGHEVFVATGMPNYPSGKVFPEYRKKLFRREKLNDCTVFRTAYFTTPRNKSKLRQLLNYLSFVPSVFISGIAAGSVDLVLVTAPPVFPIMPAIWLARLRRAKLVFDVRDLWSDELTTYAGMKTNSLAVRIARALEGWGYRRAELITAPTRSLVRTVEERGAVPGNTVYLPNGADLKIFHPVSPANEVADDLNFGDRFVVMYSGLFGIKHGLETLVETAEILRERKEIAFYLVGNGAERERLRKAVKEKRLDNVTIGDERPITDIPSILARADVCYAAVRAEKYPQKLISVKIFEYLASERPVVGAFIGESAKVLEESEGGIVVAPGDAAAVARAIEKLYLDPELRERMGRSGRAYVEKNFSREAWAERLNEMLEAIAARQGIEVVENGEEVRA